MNPNEKQTEDNSPSYGELVTMLKRSLSQIQELERQLDLPGENPVAKDIQILLGRLFLKVVP